MSAPAARLAACVLAAGAGRRMGAPKAHLATGNRTFLEQLLDSFRVAGIERCYVVGRPGDERTRDACAERGAIALENPQAELGMLSSLQICVRAIQAEEERRARPVIEGLFVAPVDCPRVRPETIATLARAYGHERSPLVLPRFEGRRGHPTLFDATLFPELLAAPLEIGARAVVWAHASDRLEVDVADPAVLEDIDTLSDLAQIQIVR